MCPVLPPASCFTVRSVVMRDCRIVPVFRLSQEGFRWEWRAELCERRSRRTFLFFHECMEDARRNGFRVLLARPTGEMAPGHFALDLRMQRPQISASASETTARPR